MIGKLILLLISVVGIYALQSESNESDCWCLTSVLFIVFTAVLVIYLLFPKKGGYVDPKDKAVLITGKRIQSTYRIIK